MKTNPLVTVIMPAYNDRETFMRESIESILNQSYSNIELLIADDSNLASTISVIDEYVSKDPRVRVIRSDNRMGVCKALNKALSVAQGEFIAHMDADDISLKDRIELQIKLFTSDDIAVVGGQMANVNENGELTGHITNYPTEPSDLLAWLRKGTPFISHPSSIVRKKVFDEICGYEELYKCSEDYDIWYRIAVLGYKFANVSSVVLHYRLHGENAHLRLADTQAKLCCISLIKYATSISGRINIEQYDRLYSFVIKNVVCRLTTQTMIQYTVLSRIVRRLHLYSWMLSKTIKYFEWRKKSLLRYINYT